MNTGNGYYGGLQFDIGFQLAYELLALPHEGHGRALDAARADVDRRARARLGARLHAVAEHGEGVRAAVTGRVSGLRCCGASR